MTAGTAGLKAWITRHKTAAAAAAVAAGVAGIYLYERSRGGSSSGGSGTAAAPARPAVTGGQIDPSYAGLENQISRLQGQVSKLAKAERDRDGKSAPKHKKSKKRPKIGRRRGPGGGTNTPAALGGRVTATRRGAPTISAARAGQPRRSTAAAATATRRALPGSPPRRQAGRRR